MLVVQAIVFCAFAATLRNCGYACFYSLQMFINTGECFVHGFRGMLDIFCWA